MIRGYLNYSLVKWLLAVGLLATVSILVACAGGTTTILPETVTITPPAETITITSPPETITITPPPETITITPTPTLIPLLWTFDTDPVGGLPQGATVFSGNWSVRAESDAPSSPNALCQTETATFPAMTLSDAVYTDVSVSTLFKPISGNVDRAAGIIFRVEDENNYYILRANALENNVDIRKYVDGIRITLKITSINVLAGQWQELRVEVVGNRIQGFLNGELVVETSDDTFQSGKVGLWTKADSVTCFDDVEVRAL